jgi:hypothetical protein
MITLEEYVADEIARIQRFKDHWSKSNEDHGPDVWPMEMGAGDWDEQLRFFDR